MDTDFDVFDFECHSFSESSSPVQDSGPSNSFFYCLGHSKNVYDDDDDDNCVRNFLLS